MRCNNRKNGLRSARIVVNLNREEYEFIDKIGRDSLFSTGRRLTNNKVIRTFVNVMRDIEISGDGLSNCEELKNRILFTLGLKKEKRKYFRFRKEVKVSWRKLESMSEHQTGKTIDINHAGFRIELEEENKPGEILEFIVSDPSMPDKPIKAFGRIVWIKFKQDKKSMEAGIQLTYVSAEDKERFNRLLCGKEEEAQYPNQQKESI